jgi:predicted DNA-binding transcriptional regulator YafY
MGLDINCPMPKKSAHPKTHPRRLPSTPVSRPPMERMWRIHQEVTTGSHPNCRQLSETLEVSSKTVMRDIEFMRDRLGLPMEYEPVRHGFFYTAPVRDFPVMKVSQGEVAALLLAQKSLEQFRGTPFERPLATAFRKLSNSFGGEMEIAWHELEQALSVRHTGTGLADMEIFDRLSKAVMDGAEVSFAYHKLAGEKPEERVVRPYHLGCIENQWYLFGHDLDRGAIRTFALPRIKAPERTGGKFRRPKDFSLAKVLEGSFAVFESVEAKRVKLRFTGVASRLVVERIWHSSQKLKQDKTAAVLEMRVGLSPDLKQWVMSWGIDVEVLEPLELRKAIADEARRLSAFYASGRSMRG